MAYFSGVSVLHPWCIVNHPNKTRLLEQIAAIPVMERRRLSQYAFKEWADCNDALPLAA
jgi:hypothetical protein